MWPKIDKRKVNMHSEFSRPLSEKLGQFLYSEVSQWNPGWPGACPSSQANVRLGSVLPPPPECLACIVSVSILTFLSFGNGVLWTPYGLQRPVELRMVLNWCCAHFSSTGITQHVTTAVYALLRNEAKTLRMTGKQQGPQLSKYFLMQESGAGLLESLHDPEPSQLLVTYHTLPLENASSSIRKH